MKILKHGNTHARTYKFKCPDCGCEFEAGHEECYKERSNVYDDYEVTTLYRRCPECDALCMVILA